MSPAEIKIKELWKNTTLLRILQCYSPVGKIIFMGFASWYRSRRFLSARASQLERPPTRTMLLSNSSTPSRNASNAWFVAHMTTKGFFAFAPQTFASGVQPRGDGAGRSGAAAGARGHGTARRTHSMAPVSPMKRANTGDAAPPDESPLKHAKQPLPALAE